MKQDIDVCKWVHFIYASEDNWSIEGKHDNDHDDVWKWVHTSVSIWCMQVKSSYVCIRVKPLNRCLQMMSMYVLIQVKTINVCASELIDRWKLVHSSNQVITNEVCKRGQEMYVQMNFNVS